MWLNNPAAETPPSLDWSWGLIPYRPGDRMYHSHRQQLEFPDFYLPFSGQLNPDNRWVKLATRVPWELAEEIYHANLVKTLVLRSFPREWHWERWSSRNGLG
jgi:hypothetical protein